MGSWPKSHVTFDEILTHIIDEYEKEHGWLNSSERDELRQQGRSTINNQVSSINAKIDEQNERVLSQIGGFLSENFSVPSSKTHELRKLLSDYLSNSFLNSYNESDLVDFLVDIVSESKLRIAKSLEDQYPDRRVKNNSFTPCTFVPSAFCSPTKSRLIYGGVLLQANPVRDDRVSERGQGGQEKPLKKSHGSAYKRTTVFFKKISMEDPNVPAHIRGYLRNEIRRTNGDWYRVRNPPGYDIDHTRDDVRYCRWKDASMNRSTSPRAERIRTRAQAPAFEIDERINEIMNKRKPDYIKMDLCYKGKKIEKRK